MKHNTNVNDLIGKARSVAATAENILLLESPGQQADSVKHDRVCGLQRGVVLVLAHHNAPMNVISSFVLGSYAYLYADESTFFKRAKFLLSWFHARYLKNASPAAPAGATYVLRGPFRRWIRARLSKFSKANTHLFFSIFQAKRAALAATEEIVLENAMKHHDAMVKPCSLSSEDAASFVEMIRPLLVRVNKELRTRLSKSRVVSELRDIEVDGQNLFSTHQSSTSASVDSSRRNGGQTGSLAKLTGNEDLVYETVELAPVRQGFDIHLLQVPDQMTSLGGQVISSTDDISVPGFEFIDNIVNVSDRGLFTTDEGHAELRAYAKDLNWSIDQFEKPVYPFGTRFEESYEEVIGHPRLIPVSDLVSIDWHPAAEVNSRAKQNVHETKYTSIFGMERWTQVLRYAANERVPIWGSDDNSKRYVSARMAFVIEPLKVRPVSAGPAATYYVTTAFQKIVHGVLRDEPQFRLIGRPASPTDLLDLRHTLDSLSSLRSNMSWFSADYVASTDNLERALSSAIMDELLLGLDPELAAVFRSSLDPHIISYPAMDVPESYVPTFRAWLAKIGYTSAYADAHLTGDKSRKVIGISKRPGFVTLTIPSCLQVNSQLMGSNSSFVVLCLANYALYMKSAERWLSSLSDKFVWTRAHYDYFRLKVLINGDDLLTVVTPEFESIFRGLGTSVGLSMSVGKTYTHRFYANINSTSYHMDSQGLFYGEIFYTIEYIRGRFRLVDVRRSEEHDYSAWELECSDPYVSSTPVCIPYLNTGLLVGQNKVLAQIDIDSTDVEKEFGRAPHIAVIDRVVDGALPGKQCRLLADYLSLHNDAIKREARGRNLFTSRTLGGWGVRIPDSPDRASRWRFDVSERQMAEARARLDNLGDSVIRAQPMGPRLSSVEVVRYLTPWASSQVPVGEVSYLAPVDNRAVRVNLLTADRDRRGIYNAY